MRFTNVASIFSFVINSAVRWKSLRWNICWGTFYTVSQCHCNSQTVCFLFYKEVGKPTKTWSASILWNIKEFVTSPTHWWYLRLCLLCMVNWSVFSCFSRLSHLNIFDQLWASIWLYGCWCQLQFQAWPNGFQIEKQGKNMDTIYNLQFHS